MKRPTNGRCQSLNQTVELRSLRSQVIMPTAHSSPSKEVVTAALLVIGGKILSGRTKDQKVAPTLKIGVRMLSETVRADAREGDIGMQLGEIAKANPAVAISSSFFDPQHRPNTNIVLRPRDAQKLALAKRAV